MSSTVYIMCSIPQGSVLGPRLSISYTADLAAEVKKHDVDLHAYADDTQLYVHRRRSDMLSTAAQLEQCLRDVSHWMSANRHKLNAKETELLWVGSRHGQTSLGSSGPSLHLGAHCCAQ